MATKRVCPDTITVFNFLGENEQGKAMYSSAVLRNVHVHIGEGLGKTHLSNDTTRLHVFDGTVKASKPFLPYSQWKDIVNKDEYWTLNPDERDYFALGKKEMNGEELPTTCTMYRINKVVRRKIGQRRMWHWRVEAQ